MFQELSDILSNRVSPEVMTGISAVCQALEKHKAVQYKEQITFLRMEANNYDPQTLVDRAVGMLFNQVHALFQVMNIKLDVDSMTYDKLAMVIEGLLFEPSDFDQDILDTIDAGEDSIEIFTEVLAITTGSIAEELMEFIIDVPMESILAIEAICQRNVDNNQRAVDGVQETVQIMNKHQNLVGLAPTIGMESLKMGVQFNDAHIMLENHRNQLLDAKPSEVADHLISIALHVKTPPEAIYDEVMHYIESMYDDIHVTQLIHKGVKARLAEMGVSQ